MDELHVREVDASRWPDLERLFDGRGGPKNCWCMLFRTDESGRSPRGKAARKAAMRRTIEGGGRVGLLAYLDGAPAAWCSVAPRPTLRRQRGVDYSDADPASVWSISCFYVRRALRRQGVMRRLLDAAIDHARANGAAVVEAYPVAPDSPTYRYCGFVPDFAARGFEEVGRAGLRRRVMRLRTPEAPPHPDPLPLAGGEGGR